jgi:cyclopropane fatty-acyl-phospholipid synthase-like methyltransferase
VGDVTKLTGVEGPFDAAFDVGCFHCLSEPQMREYAAVTHRLLHPGATLLVWTLDRSPSNLDMTPELVQRVFAPYYRLTKSQKSRRRIIASHWFWLERAS